jgi:hypothetical protein
MDRDVWVIMMAAIRRAARAVKRELGDGGTGHRPPTFPDWLIAAMELWRADAGRAQGWACDAEHYGGLFRPRVRTQDGRRLPGVSQFSRRVRSETVQAILQRVDDELSGRREANPCSLRYVDGKPVTVSPVSKDPDAGRGHVTGGMAKGYKLHAFVGENRRIACWSVMPLNVSELTVATAMLPYLQPAPAGDGLTLGDRNYDSAPLHKATSAATGDLLLTRLKGQHQVGMDGHHPVTLRQMGALRRDAVATWREHGDLARHLMHQRNNVEGVFSVLVVACGLALPPFVRRLGRVRRWVGCKIILYHARLLAQERAATAA